MLKVIMRFFLTFRWSGTAVEVCEALVDGVNVEQLSISAIWTAHFGPPLQTLPSLLA